MGLNRLRKGDGVVLNCSVRVVETNDFQGSSYLEAIKDPDAEKSLTLFDSFVGMYIGTHYVTGYSRTGKIVQLLKHRFLFGEQPIFISPDFVTVITNEKTDDTNGHPQKLDR